MKKYSNLPDALITSSWKLYDIVEWLIDSLSFEYLYNPMSNIQEFVHGFDL